MTAFESAWSLLKMPLYHGTYEDPETIEFFGLTEGGENPDLTNRFGGMMQDGYTIDDIKELFLRDYNEDDWERMMLGDSWKFAASPAAKRTAMSPGGKTGALLQAMGYGDTVFEIDDEHPDSPEWVNPEYQRYGGPKESYNSPRGYGFRELRTKDDVPPNIMRRVPQERLDRAKAAGKTWRGMFNNYEDMLEDMMFNFSFLGSLSEEEQKHLLAQKRLVEQMRRGD